MKVKWYLVGKVLVIMLGVCLFLGSCTATTPASPVQKVAEVTIGVIGGYSGPLAEMTVPAKDMINMAIGEINAKGGIKSLGGAKLTVIHADTELKPAIAISQFVRLVTDKNVAIVYHVAGSAEGMAVMPIADREKCPLIVGIVTNDAATKQGYKYSVSPCCSATMHMQTQFPFVASLEQKIGRKLSRVALLYMGDAFGQGQATALKNLMPKYGYELVADVSYPPGVTDTMPSVLKVKAANPDLIFQASYLGDGMLIKKSMAAIGYDPIIVSCGGGMSTPEWVTTVGILTEYDLSISQFKKDMKVPGAADLVTRFLNYSGRKNMGESECWAYQNTYLIAEVLEKAGTTDRETTNKTLHDIKYEGPIVGPYKGLAFDEEGRIKQELVRTIHCQVQDQNWVTVWPNELAAGTLKVKDAWLK